MALWSAGASRATGARDDVKQPPLKILVLPRDPNPYQERLYAAMSPLGVSARYVGELTPSATLNLLILPFELLWWRLFGWSYLHVHWLFKFRFPGGGRVPVLRRIARGWLSIVLRAARATGVRVVWTVHNVLPHSPIFDDDRRARRMLVGASALVLAHAENALEELGAFTGRPARSAVIAEGAPEALAGRVPALEPDCPRRVLFIGRIAEYKGVEDLLSALEGVEHPLRVVIAGECFDAQLRERIIERARRAGDAVDLRLGWVPDHDVEELMARAHAVVLPFRRATNSGSVLLAMSYGRCVIVPTLPAFSALPADAVLRYDGSVAGLRETLADVASADLESLADRGEAGRRFVGQWTWDDAAEATAKAFRALC